MLFLKNGLEGAISFLRDNEITAWRLRTSNGQNDFIFKADKNRPYEDEIARMRKVLDNTESGRIIIESDSNTGKFSAEFQHGQQNQSQVNGFTSGVAVGYVSREDMEARISELHEQWKRDREMEDLKKENAEIKKELEEKDGVLNRFMTKIEPVAAPLIGAILQKFMPAAPQVGVMGLSDIPVKEHTTSDNDTMITDNMTTVETTDEEDSILALCGEWRKVDPDFFPLLQKIATLAIDNKPIMGMPYNNVKQMILNYGN